ncbi:unnamed protein product [Gongylonema pulchrum]|uniref:Uncharacterized protein n=1 Tax=Gongylonema pulchrum TaxID=637853 RepID=A0A183DW73_9BILA|nr:unnamed protein product [Gongylonema pulchrum]
MLALLLINALFNAITRTVYGEIATMGRQPLGINPTLYDSKVDPIMQLDEMTFNDTVFCKQSTADDCTAYVVEYFPRNSSSPEYGLSLKPMPTVSEMRGIITESILVDFGANRFQDWPDFDFLGK